MSRQALATTIDTLLELPASQRARLPGLRADRADIILAAALAIDEVMRAVGSDHLEVCGQGLREGVFLEHYLAPADPPLLPDVRRSSVINAAESFGYDREHAEQIARVALMGFDATAALGLHPGDRDERDLLWAAAILHDVGVLVDYSAHHRHSEYLVLNAGLPGFQHREIALIASMVRGHRKGVPSLDAYRGILQPGDEAIFARGVALLRLGRAARARQGRAGGRPALPPDRDRDRVSGRLRRRPVAGLVVGRAGGPIPERGVRPPVELVGTAVEPA